MREILETEEHVPVPPKFRGSVMNISFMKPSAARGGTALRQTRLKTPDSGAAPTPAF
jgi:hypothetical protein